ncbi:hypothetical protein HAX54_025859 [Datura stramonium]|uniref:Uncharacterized protein n=1 Tax=Datura stramonium TaxID=4076 RepID=A0ABS8V1U2_DATST|nr:hypothetical protein [Datura stramonium]
MFENNLKSTAAFPTTISWWSWYQDLYIDLSHHRGGQTAVETAAHGKGPKGESQREGSSTGSSIGSASEVDDGKPSSETVESKCTTKSRYNNNSKGFVPYKRCLAERDGKSSGTVLEERESQRVLHDTMEHLRQDEIEDLLLSLPAAGSMQIASNRRGQRFGSSLLAEMNGSERAYTYEFH